MSKSRRKWLAVCWSLTFFSCLFLFFSSPLYSIFRSFALPFRILFPSPSSFLFFLLFILPLFFPPSLRLPTRLPFLPQRLLTPLTSFTFSYFHSTPTTLPPLTLFFPPFHFLTSPPLTSLLRSLCHYSFTPPPPMHPSASFREVPFTIPLNSPTPAGRTRAPAAVAPPE